MLADFDFAVEEQWCYWKQQTRLTWERGLPSKNFPSPCLTHLMLLNRYNAIKTYQNDDGDVILSAPMHMAAAAEAGKCKKLHDLHHQNI